MYLVSPQRKSKTRDVLVHLLCLTGGHKTVIIIISSSNITSSSLLNRYPIKQIVVQFYVQVKRYIIYICANFCCFILLLCTHSRLSGPDNYRRQYSEMKGETPFRHRPTQILTHDVEVANRIN